jgi:hypothetical protein
MGTRADFYVGKGRDAEWLGSIGWDGYPDGVADEVLKATDEVAFRAAVAEFLATRSDATMPAQGWPWPWNDSGTTDYSYWHFDGKTWGSCFGGDLFPGDEEQPEEDTGIACHELPDMSASTNVANGNRSGLIVVSL